ncbi:hypothetical protein OROHE_020327 [Orobanche hederae]
MLDVPSNVVQKKRVARILVFKIRPSQEILKIRDGTPLEAEGILTYRKKIPRNGSVWHFSNRLDVPSNVLQKKRVARILVFKIRPSQEILKIRDGTSLEAEGILTYRKKPSKWIDVPSNVVQKKRVARILVFKIRPSQEILKIRDGTPLEAEGILTYRKKIPRNGSVWNFSNKLDVPSNVVQKKSVARILVFKIRPSQEILKIRDGTTLEMPSQEILKIRDGTPLEAEGILTYRKKIPRNGSVWNFSNKLDVPSNVVQKKRVARILVFKIRPSQEILKIRDGTLLEKRVARILVFKIRPSQEILKIRDGTPLEAEGILTYTKKIPRNGSVWHFSNKLDVPSNVLQKKRVARILVFKIRPSQEILKIRDGTPLEAEGILTYRKKIPRNGSVWHFSNRLDVPSNVLQKKRVARILVFKIRPSQEILKIRDGTPLEAEGILTYRKKPSKWIVFKIRPSQEILKIRDGTPLEKRVARILVFKIRPSQEILKIRDGTPLEAEGILTYRKKIPRNGSVWHFSNRLDVPSNVLQKKRVARILVFKIRPSQEILKIRDGTSLEAEGILTYRKKPSKWIDVPSNVVQKKRVARILVFKIRPSQEILKIRDGTPLEAEGILTYRKKIPRNGSVWNFSNKLDVPSNVVQKKSVARILVFKIRPSQEILKIRDGTTLEMPSQEILKIRDGTPLEAEGILTYRKKIPRNGSVWNFSNKLDVPSNVVQKKRVARILVFKIRPSQEILKIRDGTLLEKRVARILVFKIRPSQEILKIRDGTPLEAEGILTYRKKIPRNGSVWHFSNKLDVPSNVLQKKRVARILVFKIRPSQEILKIRDGTPLEAEGILTYRKKIPRNGSVWHFSNRLDVPSNVLQKKRVARILVFKIRPSQEILKIRDGTSLEKRVARILVFQIRPSQEILKIRDGTPLEAEGILTYRKKIPRNGSVWHFYNKLDIPSNVVQKKRVARILVFKIRPSQEILKIRDGTSLEKRVARILVFKIRPSQEILKIRDGTPLEAEGILTYKKKIPRNGSVWNFSNKLDVPSNVVQKKRVARILVFKIRPSQEILKIRDGTLLEMPSQEILKIRDGTPLEAEGILTYRKKIPRNGSVWHFYNKLDIPSNVVQKKRVARILVFKIRPSQEILKIRDVARILVFQIRPSQEILKIRDGTPLEAEGILTYRKKIPRNGSVWHFYNKLDIPSNVVQKKRVARILVFKIRPSQEILKIRDGTSLEKRVARILVFKIRPSQEILKIRDGTPLEAEGILTYKKKIPRNGSVWNFSNKLDVPSNVVQKKRVARILVFQIRPSQEILKIRDGTPLEAEGILTYRKQIPRNGSV